MWRERLKESGFDVDELETFDFPVPGELEDLCFMDKI
jgi:hypothetical protein